MHVPRRSHGFTMLELMIVLVVMGVIAALAVPSWRQFQADQRVRTATRAAADALKLAQRNAIRTGRQHLVYFAAGAGTDACGGALEDPQGNPAAILVLDDGEPGSGNCCIDASDTVIHTEQGVEGVNWGVTSATVQAEGDTGGGSMASGTTFTDEVGVQARWVLFQPDGVPVAFGESSGSCDLGGVGSGGGAVYLTNGNRDYAVIMTPLGGVRSQRWEGGQSEWVD